jgi:hypothetical protein
VVGYVGGLAVFEVVQIVLTGKETFERTLEKSGEIEPCSHWGRGKASRKKAQVLEHICQDQ